MHDKGTDAGEVAEPATNDAQDERNEAEALRQVLRIHPAAMTLEELTRELTVASTDFSEHDRVQRAVRDLIAGGLLHRVGDLVLPTRAAVNFHALLED